MKKRDTFEDDLLLAAYEKGEFKSILPSKSQFKKYQDAAQATFIKDRRVNIRLSSPDYLIRRFTRSSIASGFAVQRRHRGHQRARP